MIINESIFDDIETLFEIKGARSIILKNITFSFSINSKISLMN